MSISERQGQVVTVDVADGTERVVADLGETDPFISNVAWMPDGDAILALVLGGSGFWTQQIWLFPLPDGTPLRITNDTNLYDHMTVSADGRALAATRHAWWFSIWTARRSRPGSEHVVLKERQMSPLTWVELDWLDEQRVVFTSRSERGPVVSALDVDTGRVDVLRALDRDFAAPRVSRNPGKLLVHDDDLWELDFQNGGLRQVATDVSPCCSWPSADGQGVYFLDDTDHIRYRSLDGEASRQVRDREVKQFFLSEDEQWLGLVTPGGSREMRRVEIEPMDGGPSVDLGEFPASGGFRLAPGADALAYLSTEGGGTNVWIRELPEGEPRQLTAFDEGSVRDVAWAADGDRLALVVWGVREDVTVIRDFDPRGSGGDRRR